MNIIRLIGIQNGKRVGLIAGSHERLSTYVSKANNLKCLMFVETFEKHDIDKFRCVSLPKKRVLDMRRARYNAIQACIEKGLIYA